MGSKQNKIIIKLSWGINRALMGIEWTTPTLFQHPNVQCI